MGKVGERLKSIPQIRDFQQVAGYGMIAGQGNSYGMCIVRLKDWSERPDKADAVNAVIGQSMPGPPTSRTRRSSPSLPR